MWNGLCFKSGRRLDGTPIGKQAIVNDPATKADKTSRTVRASSAMHAPAVIGLTQSFMTISSQDGMMKQDYPQ
jgi:hypothetical protein